MILGKTVTNPGELRTPITLQAPTISVDAGGAQVPSWSTLPSNATAYAKLVYAHGPEAIASGARQAPKRVTVTIRYRTDVSAGYAFLLDGVRWQIITAPDDIQNRHEYLQFQAELVTGTV